MVSPLVLLLLTAAPSPLVGYGKTQEYDFLHISYDDLRELVRVVRRLSPTSVPKRSEELFIRRRSAWWNLQTGFDVSDLDRIQREMPDVSVVEFISDWPGRPVASVNVALRYDGNKVTVYGTDAGPVNAAMAEIDGVLSGRRVSPFAYHFWLGPNIPAAEKTPASTRSTEYRETREYGPVHLTYEDLKGLISRIRSLTEGPGDVSESLRISHGSVSWQLRDLFSLNDLLDKQKSLPFADRVEYSYGRRQAPVSDVDVTLVDHSRTVIVRGTDTDRVAAMVGAIDGILAAREKTLSGPTLRYWAGGTLATVAMLEIWWNLILLSRAIEQGRLKSLNKRALAARVIIGLWLLVAIFVLPWADTLPGAAVYAGTASFLERYSAPIWALLPLILSGLIALVGRFLKRGKAPKGIRASQRPAD